MAKDDEQERHEQLIFEKLDKLDQHILGIDIKLIQLVDQTKIINRLVRDIEYFGYGIIVAFALYLGYLLTNYFLST